MRLVVMGMLMGAFAWSGCSKGNAGAPAKAVPPATVSAHKTEAELATVTLTPEAATRIGVETTAAAVEKVAGTRTLGGEVVAPPGRAVVVTAPVAGTLTAASPPPAGTRVARGTPIFRLVPLVSNDREQRIKAEQEVKTAAAEAEASQQRLERLEQLLKDGAASVRAVEEARAQDKVGAAAHDAARERLHVVERGPIGRQGEIEIEAPFDGVLQAVAAAPGQAVAASASLFEITQVETLWVRVPVYAGDEARIDPLQPAAITALGSPEPPRMARRVTGPPSADPQAAAVDLYFALPSGARVFRPKERVSVQLALSGTEQALVVPESALVYDLQGGTWVYEDRGNHVYARRRVDVAKHVGARAVIARGIAAGTKVVSIGAAEIFGTEFGTGK